MKKIIVALVAFTIGVGSVQLFEAPPGQRLVSVVNKAAPTAVMITVHYNNVGKIQSVRGSGVFISKSGLILTCKHLFTLGEEREGFNLDPVATIELYDGELIAAKLLMLSNKSDLAILKTYVLPKVEYARLAKPGSLKIGEEVFAIGNPMGLSFTVTAGIISAINRDSVLGFNVTQSDTAINPGNSGGPLFNLRGELIGINSFFAATNLFASFSGLGFSVNPDSIHIFITDIKKKGLWR